MECYNCKKMIRTKGARYCPICGTLLRAYSTMKKYTKLTDENQLVRIEKMLVIINQNVLANKDKTIKGKDTILDALNETIQRRNEYFKG